MLARICIFNRLPNKIQENLPAVRQPLMIWLQEDKNSYISGAVQLNSKYHGAVLFISKRKYSIRIHGESLSQFKSLNVQSPPPRWSFTICGLLCFAISETNKAHHRKIEVRISSFPSQSHVQTDLLTIMQQNHSALYKNYLVSRW